MNGAYCHCIGFEHGWRRGKLWESNHSNEPVMEWLVGTESDRAIVALYVRHFIRKTNCDALSLKNISDCPILTKNLIHENFNNKKSTCYTDYKHPNLTAIMRWLNLIIYQISGIKLFSDFLAALNPLYFK